MSAYSFSPDINGEKSLLLHAKIPREISAKGRDTMTFATFSVVIGGLVMLGVLLAVLQRVVIGPIVRLTTHARAISDSGNLSARLNLDRSDEIGALGSTFDMMVGRLSEAQTQLADASRDAGKAEVASGVLHNVGNVLNSVNICAIRATEQLEEIDLADVSTIAQMIDEHRSDLGAFLTADEKGKLIPDYLQELGRHLSDGRQGVLDELQSLESNLEHIKSVVNMQQEYATLSGVYEEVQLPKVIEDALKISSAAYERHGVNAKIEVGDIPDIKSDRHRIMQVIVNLLSNAKYALGDLPEAERCVVIRLYLGSDGESACIEIRDKGVGIDPSQLTNIFAHGYTTRDDGHGFGLHQSALTANGLGGSLVAHSDGVGMGATFTLTLPLVPVETGA